MSVSIENLEQELDNQIIPVDNGLRELVVQMEMLLVESAPDVNKLVEITDSKVLAHVNNLVLGLAQIGNTANNAAQAAINNK